MYADCNTPCAPGLQPANFVADVNVEVNKEETLRRQHFTNRLNELYWEKREELQRLAGFDRLQKIKDSFSDAIWAETDPSKLPGLIAQFEATAVEQATFSAKKMGLDKLFSN